MSFTPVIRDVFSSGQKILHEDEDPVDAVLTEKDIQEYADQLGIDSSTEKDLLWIAEQGLNSRLPQHILPIEDEKGNIYFYNAITCTSSWEHPADTECKKVLKQVRHSNQVDSQSTLASGEVLSLDEFSLDLDHLNMSLQSERSFLKKVVPPLASLQGPRSVHFDIQSPLGDRSSDEGDPELDDMIERFGLMDAASLSPVFIRSPEPEDVNSLLRLTGQSDSFLRVGSAANGRSRPSSAAVAHSLAPPPSSDRKTSFLKPLDSVTKKIGPSTPNSLSSTTLEPLVAPRVTVKTEKKPIKTASPAQLGSPAQLASPAQLVSTAQLVSPAQLASPAQLSSPAQLMQTSKEPTNELKVVGLTSKDELQLTSRPVLQSLAVGAADIKLQDDIELHKKNLKALEEEWAKETLKMEADHQHQLEETKLQLAEQLAKEKMQIEDRHQQELDAIKLKLSKQKADIEEQNNQELVKQKAKLAEELLTQKTELVASNKNLLEISKKELEESLASEKKKMEEDHNLEIQKNRDKYKQDKELEEKLIQSVEQTEKELEKQLAEKKAELEKQNKTKLDKVKMELDLRLQTELKQLEEGHKKQLEATEQKLKEQIKTETTKLEKENQEQLVHVRKEMEDQLKSERNKLEELQNNNLFQISEDLKQRLESEKVELESHFKNQLDEIQQDLDLKLSAQRVQIEAEYEEALVLLKQELEKNKNLMQLKLIESHDSQPDIEDENYQQTSILEIPKAEIIIAPSPTPSQLPQQDKDLLEMLAALDKHLKSLDEKVELLHQKPREKESIPESAAPVNRMVEDSSADEGKGTALSDLDESKEEMVHLREMLQKCQRRIEQMEDKDVKVTKGKTRLQETTDKNIFQGQGRRLSGKKKHQKNREMGDTKGCHSCCDHLHCCPKIGYPDGLARRVKKIAKHMDREAAELSRMECKVSVGRSLRHRRYFEEASSSSSSSTNGSAPLDNLLPYQGPRPRSHSVRSFSGSHLQAPNKFRKAWFQYLRDSPTSTLPSYNLKQDGWDGSFKEHSRDWWTQKIRHVRDAVKECEEKRSMYNINKNI